jgi:hypothetical protein
MTVQQLLDNATSQEITEWRIIAKLENEEWQRRELDAKAEAGLRK